MEVRFASIRLQKCYESSSDASRTWGQQVARKYIQRINALYAVEGFQELYSIRAIRLHKLSGDREGQYAIALDRRWRLIVTHLEAEGKIRVEEVTQHYGD